MANAFGYSWGVRSFVRSFATITMPCIVRVRMYVWLTGQNEGGHTSKETGMRHVVFELDGL